MSLAQLSQLLPLPNEELQQIVDYAATLSKPEAVSHFSNLLGDSAQAVDFISTFNSRRQDPSGPTVPATASSPSNPPDAVPKSKPKGRRKAPAIHTPQARRVDDYAAPSGTVYNKKNTDLEYIPQHQRASAPTSHNASRSTTPKPAPKERPSSGYLISDGPSKTKSKSTPSSRSSTPKPAGGAATKISISGGTPMAGQSTALADLDAAIRALEITTNPTLDNPKARKCNCVASRHPLQGAAPNCLACGKVVCMKEGLGPCTFCGTPLLSSNDVQAMMRELKEERGREKMAADAKANRRADVARTPAPFTKPRGNEDPTLAEAEAKAREHRDRLLRYQAQNAKRTTVHDEAADFDVTGAMAGSGGGSMWASPEERARELKRQQKLLREMEWNARPDYEKRQQVVSLDLVGGKVVRKMAPVERPPTPDDDDEEAADMGNGVLAESTGNEGRGGGGAFSGNPLLGSLIKPVFDAKGKGVEVEGRRPKKTGWRRVQDDRDNNEEVILDGGIYGRGGAGDEPEC
ncbi:hypothetical protein ACRE_060950 [Hapsidospora chrysogenum ATCC 11550]|uniref:TRIP4/RQT4 C2HC5-type zinc finger domain-containing protein n=1 Tax=Hapsidospora chrysogenum (strain ATCC 11550 / CBS 779.69 / DSM 880 / IAM 14645 / JCM 23072 / IMI 49137) TaxID=857340 RepID=A0A086T1C0_HAPC1|nr:hypothetical protein ACRE_060950 [Hapsidospora chrysogenum ATCC 11550]